MLSAVKKDCITFASMLGDYQKLSCDELANGYCAAVDAKDALQQNQYFSALILRFWYIINKLYCQCPNLGLDHSDFFEWLVEAIEYACKYRAWQKPDKKVNAQQAINKCISTIRLQHYYDFNLQKHRANFCSCSLDTPICGEDESGHAMSLGDTLYDESFTTIRSAMYAQSMIQTYVDHKKIIEAIIMDTIAFNDVEKHTKKAIRVKENGTSYSYVQHSSTFWPYRLVQLLSNLPVDYDKYFSAKYKVAAKELNASLATIRNANNQKLYKYLDSCLDMLRKEYKV